jgi:DNA repair protein RadA/Sms
MSFGELGLAGEVRPVKFGAERIAEAAKQGFSAAIVPQSNVPRDQPSGMKIIGVTKLEEALTQAFA